MPWVETDVMDQRIQFVALALEEGANMAALCRRFGISRPTGYRWLQRYQASGSFTALGDRPRTPHSSPTKTAPEIEQRVVALRQRYGWGAKKLYVLLAAEGLVLSIPTINRIIKRNGLVRGKDAHRPALSRFERAEPNQLWQMDFKGRFPVAGGHCYPLSILDDHSRFAVGLYPLHSTEAQATYASVLHSFQQYGLPEAMLMDHGTPWWNTQSGLGMSWISVQLMKQGITLYFSGFRHPQTQGKVEALHRTISRDLDHHGLPDSFLSAESYFARLRYEYNYVRPHEGIDMQVPADRYAPSPRSFVPSPPEWEYESGMGVEQLNSQGSLSYHGKRYFVAKPLAGERVAYTEVDGKLLVRYRHMFVREIDLATGSSAPFLAPVRDMIYV